MRTVSSSNAYNSIQLIVSTNSIIISYIPPEFRDSSVMVFLSHNGEDQLNTTVRPAKAPIKFDTSGIADGEYQFNVYLSRKNSTLFWPYYRENEIIISLICGRCSLKIPCTLQTNKEIYRKLRRDSIFLKSCVQSTPQIQSNNAIIKKLSNTITENCHLSYEKVKSIHDWVADYVSYDYDSLENDRYIYEDNSAIGTYLKRRGVCQGYTNLMIALLRSCGIPSIGMLCFALGVSTSGGWTNIENLNAAPNHIFPIVYLSNRWFLIDITWNSDNAIKKNTKEVKTGWGTSHKYYDVSVEFISHTHRLVETIF